VIGDEFPALTGWARFCRASGGETGRMAASKCARVVMKVWADRFGCVKPACGADRFYDITGED
jgi:hypothetical protein